MKEQGIFQSLFESLGLSSGRVLGAHASDERVRYVVLGKAAGRRVLETFGEVALEPGVVHEGVVISPEKLAAVLRGIQKKTGVSRLRSVVSEEDVAAAIARAVTMPGDTATKLVVDASHIGADVDAAAKELDRHLVRRYAETDAAGKRLAPVEGIVLVGERADMASLADRLSAKLRIKVSVGDVWTTLSRPEHGVSELSRGESLSYAGAIGAALG